MTSRHPVSSFCGRGVDADGAVPDLREGLHSLGFPGGQCWEQALPRETGRRWCALRRLHSPERRPVRALKGGERMIYELNLNEQNWLLDLSTNGGAWENIL